MNDGAQLVDSSYDAEEEALLWLPPADVLRQVFEGRHASAGGGRMHYAITESTYLRGTWVVQAVDLPEGDYPFRAVFSGFEARQRAEAYAAEKNAALPAPPAKS
jgi:hypothetical protein